MRNPRRLLVALASAFAAVVRLAPEARADEGKRTSSLAWVRLEGAESCVAGSALARRVEERLRRKVFVSASDADLSIEGSIGPLAGAGFRAVLRVTARDGTVLGTREVETRQARCDAIDEKLSLVVSVLIDPDGAAAAAPAEAPAPPLAAPTVVERDRVVIVHDAPPPPSERWRFELTVAATGLAGLQPGIGLGVAPSVMLHPPRFWSVLVGGGLAASSSTDVVRDSAGAGASAEASLAHGVLAVCPLDATRGRLEAAACAGALVGALRSRGVGFDTTASTSALVAGPMASGRLTFTLASPLVATFAAALVVPLAQAEVGYRSAAGEGTLFRTSSVAGVGELGVGVQFP
jgi:hypothetical protein